MCVFEELDATTNPKDLQRLELNELRSLKAQSESPCTPMAAWAHAGCCTTHNASKATGLWTCLIYKSSWQVSAAGDSTWVFSKNVAQQQYLLLVRQNLSVGGATMTCLNT